MVAGEHLAVLYQVNTRPYSNYLHVIDFDGQTILAPMALDSESRNGSHGGDITFDGSAFIAVWREANGPRDSRIRWIRIAPKTGQITGPITITTAGDDDPEGRFLPVTTLRVEAKGNQSLVTFNRGYHDPVLAVNVQRNYAVFVDSQGQIGAEEFLPTPGVFYPFGFEAHVHRLYNEFLVLWTSSDLADPGENSSLRIFGARVAPEDHQTPAHFDSTLMVNGPEARGEPFILEHPSEHALMAWTDNRSKEGDRLNGQIELTYAYASADLTLSPIQTIGHARFIEGTAQVRGVNVGTNTILSWVDERHGSGILAPKPEVYLETIWR